MEPYDAQDCIDALRLAMVGSDNDSTRGRMCEWLLERAPASDPKDTRGVQLLVEGMQELKAKFQVP